MRKIGIIEDSRDAERFGNFLLSQSIECEIREDEGEHLVFILDEDQMDAAEQALRAFAANPTDRKYDVKPPVQKKEVDRFRQVDARTEVFNQPSGAQMPLTIGMIGISILATFASQDVQNALMFSNFQFTRGMPEIASGQIWRLITPIFLHGSMLHLAFNMMWLYQLGGSIEANEGKKLYIPFIIVTAICVHVAQYLVSGPNFIGFSGVVYAMLGYVWMMSKFRPGSGYLLAQQVVVLMVVWMFVCLTGLVGPVANTQHFVGMISGTLIGFIRAGGMQTVRRKNEFKKKLNDE